MVLYRKLWYYTENYGTLINSGKNYGTMEQEAHGPHRSTEKTVQINKHI